MEEWMEMGWSSGIFRTYQTIFENYYNGTFLVADFFGEPLPFLGESG